MTGRHFVSVPALYRFGPYTLDPDKGRLLKGDEPRLLPGRQGAVLVCLVAHAGHVVDKDTLMTAAWPDTTVSDNSLVMAVKGLRTALDATLASALAVPTCIETVIGRGYRFVCEVERIEPRETMVSPDAVAERHRAFVDGRAALESFDTEGVGLALREFRQALRLDPHFASAHKGLATACFLGFEATRTERLPDTSLLTTAAHHAQEGCRLDPRCGDAWGTLALVRHRLGEAREAVIAARTGVACDPSDWRHHVRLAVVSWGQERLRAAHQALAISPRVAQARWLAATVHVARGALDLALDELRLGCAVQDAQSGARYPAAGLHWLHGLVLAAQGHVDEGVAELEAELSTSDERHVYGREAIANSHYALGALRVRQSRTDEAIAQFEQALARAPHHPQSSLALAHAAGRWDLLEGLSLGTALGDTALGNTALGNTALGDTALGDTAPAGLNLTGIAVGPVIASPDLAVGASIGLVLQGRHDTAAQLCARVLATAPAGPAGWILPVEPTLHATARPEAWAGVLGTLADRAL